MDKDLLLNHRRNKTLKYKIRDIDILQVPPDTRLSYVENYFDPPIDLAHLHMVHYRSYDYEWWKRYIRNSMHVITNVIFLFTDSNLMPDLFSNISGNQHPTIHICAMLSIVRRPLLREVYGRLLCSNCYCAGKLVNYTINTYKNSPIYYWLSLHTLPSLTPYYSKYGWIKTDYYHAVHEDGSVYPFMIYPTSPQYTLSFHHIYKCTLFILLNMICPPEAINILLPEVKGYLTYQGAEHF